MLGLPLAKTKIDVSCGCDEHFSGIPDYTQEHDCFKGIEKAFTAFLVFK